MASEELPALGPEDFETLANLLARFAANDLDQWEAWRLNLPGGPVDVRIAVADPADTGLSAIWPRPQ
jgi:hypothetical protein